MATNTEGISEFCKLTFDSYFSSSFRIRDYGILVIAGVKKITCPGARDKLNFRQDKHIFSPNVRRASKKFSAILFDNIFRTSYLATGQVKI